MSVISSLNPKPNLVADMYLDYLRLVKKINNTFASINYPKIQILGNYSKTSINLNPNEELIYIIVTIQSNLTIYL